MSINRLPISAGLLLIIFLIQEAFINRINFFVGGFALYLAFTIAWILREERSSVVLIGFISGLIADLSPTLEAPFGLWTFTMTGLAFLISNYVRGSLDSTISPLALTIVTTLLSSLALVLFIIFGAILGQDLPSIGALARELTGNALWTFVLAPIYVPVAIKSHEISLTARGKVMRDKSALAIVVAQIFVASLMIALFGRLFYLQIADGPRYQQAALDIQSRDIVTPALRGLIVDSDGEPLAANKAGLMVTADRSILDREPDKGREILNRVAKVLKLNPNDVFVRTRLCGELPREEQNGCWNGNRYQPIPITKDASEAQVLKLLERSDLFPGISAEPVSIRTYPSLVGERGTHVLGYVGPITEADLNNEAGKRYYRNEQIGKAGVEFVYDEELRGIPGVRTVIVNYKESVTRESRNVAPIPGNHLVLNINAKLQAVVERELEASVLRARSNGYRGDAGAAVVMDLQGRVLAIASYPDYDLNIWENGITVKQAKELYSEVTGVPALSRAVQGVFAPASTFKVVSLAAAVEAKYSLKASYDCPATVQIGDRTFRNFDSNAAGKISMTTAMAISCDSIWYQIAYDEWVRDGGLKPKANPNDYFFKAAAGFGVGRKTGIDLPSEQRGRLPNRDWKLAWYDENKDFYCNYEERAKKSQRTPYLIEIARENCLDGDRVRAGDMVNFSIGQGDVLMTPVQMAVMYGAIANGGKLVQPTVARAIVSPKNKILEEVQPKVTGKLPISRSTLKFLQNSLRAVVTNGTATGAFAGMRTEVSGKTGTGQVFGLNQDGSSKDDTSWFASYAPSKRPQFVVVMMVSQGGFGASTSGLGVRRIYENIFGENGKEAIFPNGPSKRIPIIESSLVART